MWQEDLTGAVAQALGRRDALLVRAPAHEDADWAAMLWSQHDPGALSNVPGVERARPEGDRVFLTLSVRARGEVVSNILTGASPAPEQVEIVARRAGTAGKKLPDRPLPDRLYASRLGYARTAMLLRQGRGHRVLPAEAEPSDFLGRLWSDRGHTRTEDHRSRRLLLALAGSHLARTRARSQNRGAPVVASLRDVTAAFTDWFTHMRATPRGTHPGDEHPMMDIYRLNLALAHATGLVLRTGLRHLGLTAPEYL
ncbi:MAG TPA: hypothetical protein VK063_12505 [Beutenbergiaceae bacterium]|nr:hypothetical protein [Beutenbergiaceae bacterium]